MSSRIKTIQLTRVSPRHSTNLALVGFSTILVGMVVAALWMYVSIYRPLEVKANPASLSFPEAAQVLEPAGLLVPVDAKSSLPTDSIW